STNLSKFNYNLADKTCELNNDTKYFRPKYFVTKPAFVYAENPDSETPWRKLNSAPVCFGAKDNQFGRFRVEVGGSIQAVKLVHLSGQVNCHLPLNAYTTVLVTLYLSSDEELRLWYEEDLIGHTENDNDGRSCTDVFAKYL
ncbi:uncharacterized protein, partial [Acropora muricata]|uniref:uncharacterized protein n=1 Tax=Acropora muricata TaxID=159855 RepID=UPI0034E530F3